MNLEYKSHEQFVESVSNHLKERENCPTMVLVHTPIGLEIHTNFGDFATEMGILDIAKITVANAFTGKLLQSAQNGQNESMVRDIKDAIDGKKGPVN